MLILLRSFKNVWLIPELRRKLLFTLGVLTIYRFGAHIPLPGLNTVALGSFMGGAAGGWLRYFDLFSGGALQRVAIFAFNMSPYISASLITQVLTFTLPSFEALAKEGEYGKQVINQYTRYIAFALSIAYGYGMAVMLERAPEALVLTPGWGFRIMSTMVLAVGSLTVMWFAEQINRHGVGNGSSVVIFAGIVSGIPSSCFRLFEGIRHGQVDLFLLALVLSFLAAVVCIVVFLERGERRVPVQYAKRVVGQRVFGGVSTYIPFKLNSAGVVPIIFANALLGMPLMFLKTFFYQFPALTMLSDWLDYGTALNNVLMVTLIIVFAYLYTMLVFNPIELADNMRKSGGVILGIRPGRKTAEFFEYVITRVCLPGAVYLAVLTILPRVVYVLFASSSPVWFDGVSLLIAVGVALDLSAQLESTLIERNYEGFLTTGRLKGRFGR